MFIDSALKYPIDPLKNIQENLIKLQNSQDAIKFKDTIPLADYCFMILWNIVAHYHKKYEKWEISSKCNLSLVESIINLTFFDVLKLLFIYQETKKFIEIPTKRHLFFANNYRRAIRSIEQFLQKAVFKTEIYEFTLKGRHSFANFINHLKEKLPEVVQKYLSTL